MDIKYFDKEFLKFLFPQRTRLTTEYGLSFESTDESIRSAIGKMIKKDFDMIEKFLPSSAENILDIGCGLGLINIALGYKYNGCNFHLLDKTKELDTDKISGFNEKYTFYNSLSATNDMLSKNGIDESNLYLYEVDDSNIDLLKTKKFDVIMSFLSCGWHYSVLEYKELILSSLNEGGLVILDIRHNTGELEKAKEFLTLIDFVVNDAESKHTGGTIGDRYIFKKK
jgi:SAM-dependent methyltransferase